MTITNIAFPRTTLDFLRRRYFAEQSEAFWKAGRAPASRQIDAAHRRRLNRWADDLSRAARTRLQIERFLLNLLAGLLGETGETPPDDTPEWLVQACAAIQKPENFSGGARQFLRLCRRSREHAARNLRRHLGVSATDYVNRIRIEHAMRQLEMSNRDIVEIALDCGIGNLSHFYSLFRARTGMTPRTYRLSHRKPL